MIAPTPTSQAQNARLAIGSGFIAALDHSEASAAALLARYGIEREWSSSDDLFDAVHELHVRHMTSPAFDGRRIVGAILGPRTLTRSVQGMGTAQWLWRERQIAPFVRVDVGVTDQISDVQLMRPNPGLPKLLTVAREQAVFGTKMRSIINRANALGIHNVVAQQFETAQVIVEAGLTPIIEPQVSIDAPDKGPAEHLLRDELRHHLESVDATAPVILRLTLPEENNFYREFVHHPKVLKVLALSGGYDREHACARLAENTGVTASFSRVLTAGLAASQSDEEFHRVLEATVATIYETSRAG